MDDKNKTTLARDFLFFIIGIALGVPLVVFGIPFFLKNIITVTVIMISILIIVIIITLLISLFSKKILNRVFGVATTDLTHLAPPLEAIVKNITTRNTEDISKNTGTVLRIILARASWFEVRKWMLGIIFGLVATFTGLVGSSLLYKQNTLLEIQNETLGKQNKKLDEQKKLLKEQIIQTAVISQQSSESNKQMYTFNYMNQLTDQDVYVALRATIGLKQIRDLYRATNFNFFIKTTTDTKESILVENIDKLSSLGDWYYSKNFLVLKTYYEQINSCIESKICDTDLTLLFVCPNIVNIVVPEDQLLTYPNDIDRSNFNSDPLYRFQNSIFVKNLISKCPRNNETNATSLEDYLALTIRPELFGEALFYLDSFEKEMKVKLPMNKLEEILQQRYNR